MLMKLTVFLLLVAGGLIACSSRSSLPVVPNSRSNSDPAANVAGGSEATPSSADRTEIGTPKPYENTLLGKWTGTVMIDTLPASIGFIFQDNGKVVFDLGATERSRADHKIEEY